MKKGFFIFFFLISLVQNVKAHSDLYITKEFGNVKVRIKTGYHYEEIQKVIIIGKLANDFLKQNNYQGKVFLDFNHAYVSNQEADYFISFDKGVIGNIKWKEKDEPILKKNGIVIRQVSRIFDTKTTIKLLELGIKNQKFIKRKQKKIKYKQNYCSWKINTIDTLFIQKELEKPDSKSLQNILKLKIQGGEKDLDYGISYFFSKQ